MKHSTQQRTADQILARLALSTIFISGLYISTESGNFFFSYLLMAITYLFAIFRTKYLGITKPHLLFFSALIAASYAGALFANSAYTSDPNNFLSIAAKIAMLFFFVIFFTTIYNLCQRSSQTLFLRYLEVATFFAALGIMQEIFFLFFGIDFLDPISGGAKHYGSYLGIAGLSVEPAFYACSLLPAGAYYASTFVRTFRLTVPGTIILGALLLSTSSLGYIGLFISIIATLIFTIKPRHILALTLTIPMISLGAYKASQLDFFQMRMNDTLSVLKGAELTMKEGMNISTYSLAVNMSISFRALRDNYGLGSGFGTYSAVFDKYIDNYEMPSYRDTLPGRGSATSLFARLTAEIGVAAWIFFSACCAWSWSSIRKTQNPALPIAYASTFLIILLRMGEYYINGVVLVFLMLHWLYREASRTQISSSLPPRVIALE